MKIDRRLFVNFDWVLPSLVLLICCAGLLNLYSIGYNLPDANGAPSYVRQGYWILIGFMMMIMVLAVDYHFIVRYAYVLHAASVLLLIFVFLHGKAVQGSQRWLMLWGFSFQPSELIKLTIIIALARYFSDRNVEEELGLKNIIGPCFIVLVPCLLILQQPDLGTTLFLGILFFSIIILFKISRKLIKFFAVSGIILIPLCWFFLKDYQRKRILTFLNPELDPLGSGYHIIQSMIAIGSGGVLGKGYLKGTQTQLKFLPEQQTDFVFSVFAEEWGFLGVSILIILFIALILWGFKIVRHSRDMSGMLIAYGVTAYVFWGIFINIGMVLGILPVVGIPLPFLSYGGSSMVVLMMGVGLLMNVSMRRFVLQP